MKRVAMKVNQNWANYYTDDRSFVMLYLNSGARERQLSLKSDSCRCLSQNKNMNHILFSEC